MTTPLVCVQGLRKSYGATLVLDGLDLHVDPGETLALLGPNGAGKSTTIEILEGFRRRDGGEVSVLGEDPDRAGADWRAGIGVVLQSSREQNVATVREELNALASLYPNPRDVNETIEAVGLTKQASKRISSLSGGQQRRVDVAMGIIGRPRVLFLDEPTTGFDAVARRSFWELIRRLRYEGTAIVLTTHYLDEAAELADRIAIVVGGRVAAEGTPDTIGDVDARTPIVRWIDSGEQRETRTTHPAAFVSDLSARIGEPKSLEVVRPSLETIYLQIVGEADAKSEGVIA